jgi:uncharacterized Fe-S cluster protein YjdI
MTCSRRGRITNFKVMPNRRPRRCALSRTYRSIPKDLAKDLGYMEGSSNRHLDECLRSQKRMIRHHKAPWIALDKLAVQSYALFSVPRVMNRGSRGRIARNQRGLSL